MTLKNKNTFEFRGQFHQAKIYCGMTSYLRHFLFAISLFLVKGVEDFPALYTAKIELIGVDNFICKSTTNLLKIQTTNPSTYRTLVHINTSVGYNIMFMTKTYIISNRCGRIVHRVWLDSFPNIKCKLYYVMCCRISSRIN